jgi:hypothetical protein
LSGHILSTKAASDLMRKQSYVLEREKCMESRVVKESHQQVQQIFVKLNNGQLIEEIKEPV